MSEESILVRRHYLVTGRVQGVGFRNFIFKQGSGLGLKGLVRNLRDGRVEILASGDSSAMTAFDQAVSRGPVHANVTSVDKKELAEVAFATLDAARSFTVEEDGAAPWSAEKI